VGSALGHAQLALASAFEGSRRAGHSALRPAPQPARWGQTYC